jgi:hypothetical protein
MHLSGDSIQRVSLNRCMPLPEFRAWLQTKYISGKGKPLGSDAAGDYVSRLDRLSRLTGQEVGNASSEDLERFLEMLNLDFAQRHDVPIDVVRDLAVAVRRYREFLRDTAEPDSGVTAEAGSARTRAEKHTPAQFIAACEWAEKVDAGVSTRTEAIAALGEEQSLKAGSAEVLLSNYHRLRTGQAFSSPMSADATQHFVDSIVARHGAESLPGLIHSLNGYVEYAAAQWGNPSEGMVRILEALREQSSASEELSRFASAVTARPSSSVPSGSPNSRASEILREIWVRGPQHAAFRRGLLRRWSDACSVHGVACNGQLRASHIVAWRLDETLRGDVNNGLLLSTPLDSLFDQGLISFADDGILLESDQLERETAFHFGLRPGLHLRWEQLTESERQAIRANLARHRTFHGSERQHQYAPSTG